MRRLIAAFLCRVARVVYTAPKVETKAAPVAAFVSSPKPPVDELEFAAQQANEINLRRYLHDALHKYSPAPAVGQA